MSDVVTHVSDSEFATQVLESERPVIVDFWAEWCHPCHMVAPVVEEIARENPERVKAVKVNIDDNPEIAGTYGIMSIPTLMLFSGGEVRATVIGARGKDYILREFEPHLST